MTEDERRLAELAVEKHEATERLKACRDELKALARRVRLPVIVPLNGHAVHVSKPLYASGMPVCKVARIVRTEDA